MAGNPNERLSQYTADTVGANQPVVSGVISRIAYHGGRPHLHFVNESPVSEGLPLAILLGHPAKIRLQEHHLCTECGEPAAKTPCQTCRGNPPYATCVKQPGTACEFRACKFPTFKQRSCQKQFAIYLTASDKVKVGITSLGRTNARWHEQAATHGIRIATVSNRRAAGLVERELTTDHTKEKLKAAVGVDIGENASQTWTEPLTNPISTLVDTAIAAKVHIPEPFDKDYRFPESDQTEVRKAVRRVEHLTIDGRSIDNACVNADEKALMDSSQSQRAEISKKTHRQRRLQQPIETILRQTSKIDNASPISNQPLAMPETDGGGSTNEENITEHVREHSGSEYIHRNLQTYPDFPHRILNTIGKIEPGGEYEGLVVGVRGNLLVTNTCYLHTGIFGGHYVEIQSEAPFVDRFEDLTNPHSNKDTNKSGGTDLTNEQSHKSPSDQDAEDNTPNIPAAEFF